MKNYPKISIVTPSYNQGQYLEDTILSVLGQFYPNLEYLIYDAASSDNSVEIIKKYEDQLSFWVSQKDNGQADAINRGFLKATGEILMWLNSDDVLMPNVLHFIAEQYVKNGEGIYCGNCIHFREVNPNGLYASGSNVASGYNSTSLELADTIIQPSSFWTKKVWLENGLLDDNLHYGFDWEWFLRAKHKNISFYFINKPISLYRFHDAHKSGVGGKKRQEELLEIYKKYSPKYAQLYHLVRTENFTLSSIQKVFFHISSIFLRDKFTKTHLIKILKRSKYQDYSVEEINKIRGML